MKFQLGAEDVTQEFLSVHSELVDKYERRDNVLLRTFLVRNSVLNIHNRKVLSVMEFLEKLGGLQASLFLVAAIVNYLITGKQLPLQLIELYYSKAQANARELISAKGNETKRERKLSKRQKLELSRSDKLVYGTSLHWIC